MDRKEIITLAEGIIAGNRPNVALLKAIAQTLPDRAND